MAIKESNRLEYQGLTSDSVVQTTGDSTTDVMSQKAVTDAISGGTQIQWGTITGNVTLTDNDSGKTFLVTNDAVITISDGLSSGWNVAFIPDDSKDSTVHNVTLAFSGSGSVIGNTTTIKGASSLALTPITGLFAAAGAIE